MRGARYLSLSQAYPVSPQVSPQLLRTRTSFCFVRLAVATARTACRTPCMSGSSESTTPSASGCVNAMEIVLTTRTGWSASTASQT
jgi:hypothetical protein